MKTHKLKTAFAVTALVCLLQFSGPDTLCGRTLYLSPAGDDSVACAHGAVFRTLKQAVSCLEPGDTLIVREGECSVIRLGGQPAPAGRRKAICWWRESATTGFFHGDREPRSGCQRAEKKLLWRFLYSSLRRDAGQRYEIGIKARTGSAALAREGQSGGG